MKTIIVNPEEKEIKGKQFSSLKRAFNFIYKERKKNIKKYVKKKNLLLKILWYVPIIGNLIYKKGLQKHFKKWKRIIKFSGISYEDLVIPEYAILLGEKIKEGEQ